MRSCLLLDISTVQSLHAYSDKWVVVFNRFLQPATHRAQTETHASQRTYDSVTVKMLGSFSSFFRNAENIQICYLHASCQPQLSHPIIHNDNAISYNTMRMPPFTTHSMCGSGCVTLLQNVIMYLVQLILILQKRKAIGLESFERKWEVPAYQHYSHSACISKRSLYVHSLLLECRNLQLTNRKQISFKSTRKVFPGCWRNFINILLHRKFENIRRLTSIPHIKRSLIESMLYIIM